MFDVATEQHCKTQKHAKPQAVYQVLDSCGEVISGLFLKKDHNNYQVFQDGYYVGRLSFERAEMLRLEPCNIPACILSFEKPLNFDKFAVEA